jgi:hypothetical protein
MEQINIEGVQTRIYVRAAAGPKWWTWEFHCENGINGRNTEELCRTRAAAWDEAYSAARQAIQSNDKV